MTDTTGLVVQGDDGDNTLYTEIKGYYRDNRLIYNVVHAAGGDDDINALVGLHPTVIKHYGTQLFGEDGNDHITDSRGSDTLDGGAGDDFILSNFGKDIIDGGDGTDTLEVYGGSRRTLEAMSVSGVEKLVLDGTVKPGGFDLTQFDSVSNEPSLSSTLKFTQQAAVENVKFGRDTFQILGSMFGDTFDVANSPGSFTIKGGDGDDHINAGHGTNYLDGQHGDDSLTGGMHNDTIWGGGGNDVINGAGGDDYVLDSDGSNTVHGGNGDDGLSLLNGNNRVYGDDGDDTFGLRYGKDIVDGGTGDDKFFLILNHGSGAWSLGGGTGNDHLYALGNMSGLKTDSIEQLSLGEQPGKLIIAPDVLQSFDAVLNAANHEIIFSHAGDFTWKKVESEGSEIATLAGSDGADHIDLSASKGFWSIAGRGGNDTLTGAATSDTLTGGEGNDVLIGTTGRDHFEGGKGKDTFVFSNIRGQTEIGDFTAKGALHDIINLSAVESLSGFDDLMKHHIYEFEGAVVIWFRHNNIILDGVATNDLSTSDFQF